MEYGVRCCRHESAETGERNAGGRCGELGLATMRNKSAKTQGAPLRTHDAFDAKLLLVGIPTFVLHWFDRRRRHAN